MNTNTTNIIKASGEKVPFSPEKFKESLRRSGASKEAIDAITEEVKKQLYEGMPTRKIYILAFGLLRKYSKPIAARYKLKKAIMELGPTGYPFEKFFAELLKQNGFTVSVGQIVKGHCVNHEVDVIAEKKQQLLMIECKFHQNEGNISNVKIPLYIEARFRDIEKERKKIIDEQVKITEVWVVTNTKFSTDAIVYGTCMGMHLVGWNFPATGSLNYLIEEAGLYPLTCLTTLTKNEKQILLDNKIVLCRDLLHKPTLLQLANIKEARFKNILDEVIVLCSKKK